MPNPTDDPASNDTQHHDTQHRDTQHRDTQHRDTQHRDTQHRDTQHRAIVFGATGYTGRALLDCLTDRGIATWAHVRPGSSRKAELRSSAPSGVTVAAVPWDVDAIDAWVAEVRPTLAFGALGITASGAKREARRTGGDAPTYESVDYALTARAIDACARADSGARFVYISSMGVKPGTRNPYLLARVKAEQHLASSGLPYVIARPGIIAGERDEHRTGEAFGAAAMGAAAAVLGAFGAKRGARAIRPRTNVELASALVKLALDPSAVGRTFESADF